MSRTHNTAQFLYLSVVLKAIACMLQVKCWEGVLFQCQELISKGLATAAVYLNAGIAQLEQGNKAAACKLFQKAVLLDPNANGIYYAHHNLGLAAKHQATESEAGPNLKLLGAAVRHFTAALSKCKPECSAPTLKARADCLALLGRLEEAAVDYMAAVALGHRADYCLYNGGICLYNLGQFADAAAAFAQLVAIAPEHGNAAFWRAKCELKAGLASEPTVIEHLKQAITLLEAPIAEQEEAAKARMAARQQEEDKSEGDISVHPRHVAQMQDEGDINIHPGEPETEGPGDDITHLYDDTPQPDARVYTVRQGRIARVGEDDTVDFMYLYTADAWGELAYRYLEMGASWTRIRKAAERALAYDYQNAPALTALGQYQMSQQAWRQAYHSFSLALTRRPSAEVFLLRGTCCLWLCEHQAAIHDFDRSLAADSNNVSALKLRAHSYTHLGQWTSAAADYSRLVELGYSFADTDRYNHALSLFGVGQVQESLAQLERIAPENNAQPYNLQLRAQCLEALGDPDAALDLLEDAAYAFENQRNNPGETAQAWAFYAQMCMKHGLPEEAQTAYTTALQWQPDFVAAKQGQIRAARAVQAASRAAATTTTMGLPAGSPAGSPTTTTAAGLPADSLTGMLIGLAGIPGGAQLLQTMSAMTGLGGASLTGTPFAPTGAGVLPSDTTQKNNETPAPASNGTHATSNGIKTSNGTIIEGGSTETTQPASEQITTPTVAAGTTTNNGDSETPSSRSTDVSAALDLVSQMFELATSMGTKEVAELRDALGAGPGESQTNGKGRLTIFKDDATGTEG